MRIVRGHSICRLHSLHRQTSALTITIALAVPLYSTHSCVRIDCKWRLSNRYAITLHTTKRWSSISLAFVVYSSWYMRVCFDNCKRRWGTHRCRKINRRRLSVVLRPTPTIACSHPLNSLSQFASLLFILFLLCSTPHNEFDRFSHRALSSSSILYSIADVWHTTRHVDIFGLDDAEIKRNVANGIVVRRQLSNDIWNEYNCTNCHKMHRWCNCGRSSIEKLW